MEILDPDIVIYGYKIEDILTVFCIFVVVIIMVLLTAIWTLLNKRSANVLRYRKVQEGAS